MANTSPPFNWKDVDGLGKEGRLMELLAKVPRAHWALRDQLDNTLLHFACTGPDVAAVKALLACGLLNASELNTRRRTPAHYAAANRRHCVLETLCAAGADLGAQDADGTTPFEDALRVSENAACVRVLVANGVRLGSTREHYHHFITPELRAFESGVLRCRAAVVAMLRVKRASGKMVRWDKFLLHLIAVCVWSTRGAREWQN